MTTPFRLYSNAIKAGEITPDPVQEKAVQELDTLYHKIRNCRAKKKFFKRKKHIQGIYMYGDVGRGKSMLMDLFADCSPLPERTTRIHFHQFMQDLHGELHQLRQDGANTSDALAPIAARMAKEMDILCFDEFFVTNIADAMILQRFLELMLKHKIIIVSTSNRHPDELYKNGLQRERFLDCIELIKQKFLVIEVNGDTDYRTTKEDADQKYLYPLSEDNTVIMEHIFRDLIDDADLKPVTIKAKGRKILIEETYDRAAFVTFDQMCRENRGAADYLAIAKRFDTIFIDHIPQMTEDDRNEASRFVTMIDTFYEKKVKIYCVAATPADTLYVVGEGSFEFQRTVSRLKEMTSENWPEN